MYSILYHLGDDILDGSIPEFIHLILQPDDRLDKLLARGLAVLDACGKTPWPMGVMVTSLFPH
jgi:hypothetical protein